MAAVCPAPVSLLGDCFRAAAAAAAAATATTAGEERDWPPLVGGRPDVGGHGRAGCLSVASPRDGTEC